MGQAEARLDPLYEPSPPVCRNTCGKLNQFCIFNQFILMTFLWSCHIECKQICKMQPWGEVDQIVYGFQLQLTCWFKKVVSSKASNFYYVEWFRKLSYVHKIYKGILNSVVLTHQSWPIVILKYCKNLMLVNIINLRVCNHLEYSA